MLSVTTRISARFYGQVLFARGLCSAPSKPRRRKNGVKTRIPPETVSHDAESVAPSEATSSLAMNKKLLKASTSAAINRTSTSTPLKEHSVPVMEVKKPKASPQMSVTELSEVKKSKASSQISATELPSLLSLDEAGDVSSHPILKFVDFSVPLEEANFSSITNPSRFISALRLCHKFSHGCAFIRLNLATLSGPAVLEAARLLADSELRRRCALRLNASENLQQDMVALAQDLRERFESTRLPPSMAVAINILLGCVIDPSRTVAEISVNEMKQMIFRAEVHHNVACAALDIDQWDKFKSIMGSCRLSPHYSPILVFHITNFILRNPERQKEVLEWYLNALSFERKPLTQPQWSNYAENIIRVCGMKSDPVTVTKSGKIEVGTGKNQELLLPKEEPFDEQDFSCLKNDLNSMLSVLSKGSGSVTRKEVFALRKSIQSWSKGNDQRAVVIDSLNVFHGAANGFDPLVRLTNRLTAEYDNAILVTRPFLVERLRSVRWRGNVYIFSCTTLSEDDLLVLLAAVEWGPNAFVLSNDRFGVHVGRANSTGRLSLEEWMRRRILHFDRLNWQYEALPEYGEFVQKVTPGTYFIPISEETPGIPKRSARLVTL